MIEVLLRVLPLFAVMGLGVLAGALRLFAEPARAIEALNRFALYVAFPLLVVASLADTSKALAGSVGFYVAHGVAVAVQLAIMGGVTRLWGRPSQERGPVQLGAMFGNIAYLGIPFCTSVLGEAVTGVAALSAALHILVGMAVGPALLVGGSGQGAGQMLRRVLSQPLVWSPIIGLALRLLPWPEVGAEVVRFTAPVGAAASPVALFLIGIYLHTHRRELVRPDLGLATVTLGKLALYPAIAWGVTWCASQWWTITPNEAAVVVLVAAMPVAVTTFALAEEFGRGREVLSRAIVVTTTLSVLTLPVWVALLSA